MKRFTKELNKYVLISRILSSSWAEFIIKFLTKIFNLLCVRDNLILVLIFAAFSLSLYYIFLFLYFSMHIFVYMNTAFAFSYFILLFTFYKGYRLASIVIVYIIVLFHLAIYVYLLGFASGFHLLLFAAFLMPLSAFSTKTNLILSPLHLMLILFFYTLGDYSPNMYADDMYVFSRSNAFFLFLLMSFFGFVLSFINIHSMQSLNQLVNYDFLTGLFNRRYIDENILKDIKSDYPTTIAIADIDDFKSINDNFGHDVGDLVLKLVSSLMQKFAKESGAVVGRWGGEEFLIKIDDLDLDTSEIFLDELRELISQQRISMLPRPVTVTIGAICILQPKKDQISQYFLKADELLYKGKSSGKNQVVLKEIEG